MVSTEYGVFLHKIPFVINSESRVIVFLTFNVGLNCLISILLSKSRVCIISKMEARFALAFVNGVVGKLGEIAAEKALNEASLLLNFKSDFKWLGKQLGQIFASLQAADELSGHSEGVKEWLAEVRNIAFDAEDIIDECAVEHLYTNTRQSCVCNWNQLVFKYKMGKRIKKLKERMNSTVEAAQRLKLFHDVSHLSQPSTSSTSTRRSEELQRWDILKKHAPAVAIDHKMDEILTLLDNPAVGIVAVVGMGGLGKTFLLRHVYDRTKHRYDCSAWITVSQTYSFRSLQSDLAFQISLPVEGGITDELVARLIRDKLEGKSCLIVLDDVWTSVHDGLILGLGLPTVRNRQCKIVVSTRSRDVAENMTEHIYEMQHLSKGESWDLFCMYAFPHREGNRPPAELEGLAHQVVEECARLPLAIKTIAASMDKSSLISDWVSKVSQLKEIGKTEDSIMKILKLSYDNLPPNLKFCFSYLSFFPEDTNFSFTNFKIPEAIYHDYIIYLWIAEGCIPQGEDREQWDIGLSYLHQLENLCLLEVDRVFSSYSIHDLLRDLAVNICKEHECEFELPSKETRCRRLLLAKKGLDTNAISQRPLLCQQYLHTLSFCHNPDITRIPEHLLDHATALRIIDFSRTAISTLPKCIGKLKLLKVLNLSYTQIREVPDCVRRLKSLQFLDVSYCKSLQRVPDWIGELKSLSYLNIEMCSDELWRNRMPKGISQLLSLRTFKSTCFPLDTEDNEFLKVKDVGNLINLREIHFRFRDVQTLRSIEDGALDGLVKMRTLTVQNDIPNLPGFPEKMKVMKDLQQLSIVRFSVPSWLCGMEYLTDLNLNECTDYPSLQKMPNLRLLYLKDDSKCRELPKEFGESGGFPKLVKLAIEDFRVLEELPALEEGAMQSLEGLVIMKCPQVKRVPKGLERLRRLKRILVVEEDASEELKERLKEGGEDWNRIITNNPRIQIVFYQM